MDKVLRFPEGTFMNVQWMQIKWATNVYFGVLPIKVEC